MCEFLFTVQDSSDLQLIKSTVSLISVLQSPIPIVYFIFIHLFVLTLMFSFFIICTVTGSFISWFESIIIQMVRILLLSDGHI